MVKDIKRTNIKTIKNPKKSSSKENKVKRRRYFSYHFIKRKKGTKSKKKKDNFPSINFGSTKPTVIELESVNLEHLKIIDNTIIISDILLDNQKEFDFFSYENIRNVSSNKGLDLVHEGRF